MKATWSNEGETEQFKPFSTEPSKPFDGGGTGASEKSEQSVVTEVTGFSASKECWESLLSSDSIRGHIDVLVESKVAELLEIKVNELRDKATEEGHEAGRKEGFDTAKVELQECRAQLNKICEALLAKEEQIVHGHEVTWARAIRWIASRFFIPRTHDFFDELGKWVKKSLDASFQNRKLAIHLSTEDFDHFNQWMDPEGQDQWQWVRDAHLGKGEIQCLSNRGGVLFSEAGAKQELNNILDKYFPEALVDPEPSVGLPSEMSPEVPVQQEAASEIEPEEEVQVKVDSASQAEESGDSESSIDPDPKPDSDTE